MYNCPPPATAAAPPQAPSDAVLDAYAACNNAVDVAVAKGGIAACPPACAGEKAAVGEPCVGEYFSYGAAAFRGWAARLTAGDTLGVEELQYIQRFADIHAPIGGYPAIDATALAAAMPGAVAEILSGSAQALRQLVAECGLVTGEAAAAAAAAAARALGEAPAAAPAASAAGAPAARAALALLLTALALAA
jgi:hypothetical protein